MKRFKKNKEKQMIEVQINQGTSKIKLSPWKVLIVDDEPDVHAMTLLAFKDFEFAGKKLQIFQAMSGMEARQILVAEPDMAVALIDVVMETDDAGLQLVNFIRHELQDSFIRLIIRTDQPGMAPEKEVIERYDINDYKDKTELTAEKLYIAMRSALENLQLYLDLKEANQIILQLLTVSEQTRQEAEQAHYDAELANQVKKTFLANMSHELRTPLNSILGYSRLLIQDTSLNLKQQKEASIIQHSGNYLLTLINDILELAKMETDGIKLNSSDFLCNPFLEDIVKLFQIHAEQKGISFIYQKLSPVPTVIHADKKRLRQILINLLGNAVKFTERGGVIFKVGLQDQFQNLDTYPSTVSQRILFEVEDTGIGIATEELEKIFLPFQQRDMGNQLYKVEGSGVGLSITKKLVEMMGGELQVESTLGQGSTFWTVLTLPTVPQMETKITEEKEIIVGYQAPQRKILVIDDEPEYLMVFTDLLKPLGFEVIKANDGQEGLNKVYTYQPDLIITDLVMPIMDGFELIRQLRKIPKLAWIPIITVSASVLEVSQQTGSELSYFDFLSKPIRAEALLNILQKHLGLTWIYESEKPLDNTTNKRPCSNFLNDDKVEKKANLIAPSPEQVAILFDLTMAGDLDGILEQADKLEQQDKQLLPFVCKIRQLAENFKVKEIRKLVRQYLD